MCEFLSTQRRPHYQNCDHTSDDPRYLQLDQPTPVIRWPEPHLESGLLCGPCNRTEINIYMLSGLNKQAQHQERVDERMQYCILHLPVSLGSQRRFLKMSNRALKLVTATGITKPDNMSVKFGE